LCPIFQKFFLLSYRLAPEHPFPTPTDDCWAVVEHVIKNAKALNVNVNKLILAGDSAGGNAALVLSKRLARESTVRPILQVLIYPWTQLAFSRLPSSAFYKGGLFSTIEYTRMKLWYLGFKEITDEMKQVLILNNHTLLLSDTEKEAIKSYLNKDLIPRIYRTNRVYYELYRDLPLFNTGKLDSSNILVRDKEFARKVKQLFSEEVSPGLASLESLKLQPKTYQIICEWDGLKDEGLILGERMKQAGVQVELAFYEQCFHGMVSNLDQYLGFKQAHIILNDLVNYINVNSK
jgi:acetyl esterase/lipase